MSGYCVVQLLRENGRLVKKVAIPNFQVGFLPKTLRFEGQFYQLHYSTDEPKIELIPGGGRAVYLSCHGYDLPNYDRYEDGRGSNPADYGLSLEDGVAPIDISGKEIGSTSAVSEKDIEELVCSLEKKHGSETLSKLAIGTINKILVTSGISSADELRRIMVEQIKDYEEDTNRV